MGEQRLVLSELDNRVDITINRNIAKDNNGIGIMQFGADNNYPQFMERVILSSIDARVIANMNAKFLVGGGFNDIINQQVVGKDGRGQEITVISLLRRIAQSLSMHNGALVHVNYSFENPKDPRIIDIKPIPFKNCRFTKPNDLGYCAKVAVYDNWENDPNVKFDRSRIRFFNTYTRSVPILLDQVRNNGGVLNHKGHVAFLFLDNHYLYPPSPFDPVYLDCDTQANIGVFKNNQIRNGFTDKMVFRVAGDPDNVAEIAQHLRQMMGPDGDNCTVIEDKINPETNRIDKEHDVLAEKITTNINDKLFENWERTLSNNIRKANMIPQILIDYETSNLGTTSGESISQAVNLYNELTKDDRACISQFFRDIFSRSANEVLRNNTDWDIRPLNLMITANQNIQNDGKSTDMGATARV